MPIKIEDENGVEKEVFTPEEVEAEKVRMQAEFDAKIKEKDEHVKNKLEEFTKGKQSQELKEIERDKTIEETRKMAEEARQKAIDADNLRIEEKKNFLIEQTIGSDPELKTKLLEAMDQLDPTKVTDLSERVLKAASMIGLSSNSNNYGSVNMSGGYAPDFRPKEKKVSDGEHNQFKDALGLSDFIPKEDKKIIMPEENKDKKGKVAFSPEQMEIIQKMLNEAKEGNKNSSPSSLSMYNVRDIKAIETVNVKRYDGKFVIGLKDYNTDSFKKKPRYWILKEDKSRGLIKEPFVTLILSDEEGTQEEKEIPLVDYTNDRDFFKAKVLKIDVKEVIDDNGVLGSQGDFAVSINDKGIPESRPTIRAEVKREERVFHVELPGFSKPVAFIPDFLA